MSDGVAQLLEAEQRANRIIQDAQDMRAKLVKTARTDAEKELAEFKAAQEKKYNEEIEKIFGVSSNEDDLKASVQQEIQKINKAFDERKNDVINLLIDRVMNVTLEIPLVVKKSLAQNKK